MPRSFAALLLAAALAACGQGDAAAPAEPKWQSACAGYAPPPASVSEARVRRLSDGELDAVASDLVGEPVGDFANVVPDPRSDGYDSDARALVVSGPKLEAWMTAAESVAPRLAATARCAIDETPRACAGRFAHRVAPRAFGRPVTNDEIDALLGVFDVGGMPALAQAILVAPSTIYRTELGTTDAGGALDDWEIASQLSFLITGARPDDELWAAAAAGTLHDPEIVRAQAKRLLATPRARAQMTRFFEGWLETSKLLDAQRLKNGELPPALKRAMKDELDRFVEHTVFEGDGTLDALLLGTTTTPEPALVPIYGADLLDPARGTLDPAHRRGVLSLPGFLTQHAALDATNPVDRGLFVRTRLLCQEMGAPPLAAFKVPIVGAADKSATTREKYEIHARDPACSGCHQLMDPIGFGFESFDEIGRFRTKENGFDVDDSGELSDADVAGTFHGPAELAQKLAASDEVRACFVTQMYRFAEGRAPDDPCELGALSSEFVAKGDRIDELFLAYVTRKEFFVRKAGAP
jgi:hypothetical protein